MTKETVDALLRSANYRFAKTMPETPHDYTLRKTWADETAFEDVVRFIQEHGQREWFRGRQYTYYYLDEYKYWTMGNPPEYTILINRADNDTKDYA